MVYGQLPEFMKCIRRWKFASHQPYTITVTWTRYSDDFISSIGSCKYAFIFMPASGMPDERKQTTWIRGCPIWENAIPRVTFSVPNFRIKLTNEFHLSRDGFWAAQNRTTRNLVTLDTVHTSKNRLPYTYLQRHRRRGNGFEFKTPRDNKNNYKINRYLFDIHYSLAMYLRAGKSKDTASLPRQSQKKEIVICLKKTI